MNILKLAAVTALMAAAPAAAAVKLGLRRVGEEERVPASPSA